MTIKKTLAVAALALITSASAYAGCTQNCQFKVVIPGLRGSNQPLSLVTDSSTGALQYSDGTYASSCQAYLQPVNSSYPAGTSSGIYRIQTGGNVIPVYCNQTLNGGGWTLLVKQASGDGSTLQGNTTYWTNGTTLNDSASNQNMNDGNFVSAAFASEPVTQFMLQAANETTVQTHTVSSSQTALAAFSAANLSWYSDPAGVPTAIPNWFIHATMYPNGKESIAQARLDFNFMEGNTTYVCSSGVICDTNACGARWGWATNNDTTAAGAGTDDACGGLGAYGSAYLGSMMGTDKGAWQPATLYLWAK
jgi:hypothetical protein